MDREHGGGGAGAMSVNMLSKEEDDYVYIRSYTTNGFSLTNGFRILGPCVVFPRTVLHWSVSDYSLFIMKR